MVTEDVHYSDTNIGKHNNTENIKGRYTRRRQEKCCKKGHSYRTCVTQQEYTAITAYVGGESSYGEGELFSYKVVIQAANYSTDAARNNIYTTDGHDTFKKVGG